VSYIFSLLLYPRSGGSAFKVQRFKVEKSPDSAEIARGGYVFITTWVFTRRVREYGMLPEVITG